VVRLVTSVVVAWVTAHSEETLHCPCDGPPDGQRTSQWSKKSVSEYAWTTSARRSRATTVKAHWGCCTCA